MSSKGKLLVVGSAEQIKVLIPLALKVGTIVWSVKHPTDIAKLKVKRIDVLPGNVMTNSLAAHCRSKKIQVFRWTVSQWDKLLEESNKGGDSLDP